MFKIEVKEVNGTTAQQVQTMKAAKLVENCINSDDFMAWYNSRVDAVIAKEERERTFKKISFYDKMRIYRDIKEKVPNPRKFTQLKYNSHSLENLRMKIKRGMYDFGHWKPYVHKLYVTWYYKKWSSAVGYTFPDTPMTYINGAKLSRIDHIAGNIAHEMMHKLGYDHTFNWTPDRKDSVPYAIGYYVQDWVKETMDLPSVTYRKKPWWRFW